MHYYQFNIGDYRKDTIHLSRLEHSIYRDLIDWYYLEETPIPTETQSVMRRLRLDTDVEKTALQNVLSDFFKPSLDGYRQARIDQEIADYHAQCDKNKANGKKGGRPKGKKTQSVSSGLPVASQVDATANPDQRQPLTTNQEPYLEAKASLSPAKLPPCPSQEIISLYHSVLPELPAIKLLSDQRKKAIGVFWKWVLTSKRSDGLNRANSSESALEWICAYFQRARDNDFLMGRNTQTGPHANWQCDLDFLLTEKGKKQVIEKTKETA